MFPFGDNVCNKSLDWLNQRLLQSYMVKKFSMKTGILNFTHRILRWLLLWLVIIGFPVLSFALEPVPKDWSHLPMDINFGGFAFAHTEADIFFDPTLLLDDVKMTVDTTAAKYIRKFELFEKSSPIDITQGYQRGK